MRGRCLLIAVVLSVLGRAAADQPPAVETPAARTVLTDVRVHEVLVQTADWYREFAAQQQAAVLPNDLVIWSTTQPIADKILNLTFDLARSNAELLSSEADATDASSSPLVLNEQYNAQKASILSQQGQLSSKPQNAAATQTQRSRLDDELNMINARRNLLATLNGSGLQKDTNRALASKLKSQIDAIAISFPSAAETASGAPAHSLTTSVLPASSPEDTTDHTGVWDVGNSAWRLLVRMNKIAGLEDSTDKLKDRLSEDGQPVLGQLMELESRSDALLAQAQHADAAAFKDLRDEFDTVAWIVQQTSRILTDLQQLDGLLQEYRHNLDLAHESVARQYRVTLAKLSVRVGILLMMLALTLAGSQIWRRMVDRHARDPQHRRQLLWVRNVATWTLAIAILCLTPATVISSMATFAGLIAAGAVVAMQSVLLSVVAYFFLLGKHGVRAGDRVQIGTAMGKVIDLGLVRMHLLELSNQEPFAPTGRVITFANSIVFQAQGGLQKQLAESDFVWREFKVNLPAGSDFEKLRDGICAAVTRVLDANRGVDAGATATAAPEVTLQFAPSGVEAVVRYLAAPLQKAREIDERVFAAVLQIIGSH